MPTLAWRTVFVASWWRRLFRLASLARLRDGRVLLLQASLAVSVSLAAAPTDQGAKVLWVVNRVETSPNDSNWYSNSLSLTISALTSTNAFTSEDIPDEVVGAFAYRLRSSTAPESQDRAGRFLWDQFSASTTNLLSAFEGTTWNRRAVKSALVDELNRIVVGQRLDRFDAFLNNPYARTRSGTFSTVTNVLAFNRMSLGDAFPMELSAVSARVERGHYVRTLRHSELGLDLSEGAPGIVDRLTLLPDTKFRIPPTEESGELTMGTAHSSRGTGPGRKRNFKAGDLLLGADRTDFIMTVRASGEALVQVAEGVVLVTNSFDLSKSLTLTNGMAARLTTNRILEPLPTFKVYADNVAQTLLYYPGMLHLEDLKLSRDLNNTLSNSLAAYRVGNLPRALAEYIAVHGEQEPTNAVERLYMAALVLVVGQFEEATSLLGNLPETDTDRILHAQIAQAIRQTIASVRDQEAARTNGPTLATEWLAESYYQLSRRPYMPSPWESEFYGSRRPALERALMAAKKATAAGTNFGFAWVRRAELEFSFGDSRAARAALDQAKDHQLGNAQAVALLGFLAWASNDYSGALRQFRAAAALDARLGNAWLGVGLTQLRDENVFAYLKQGNPLQIWRARPESAGLS
ncbi:MAG: hypothetical protein L0387_31205, partial [Acidobacteria bacterium]|nr:hypothetical protein [Acidobacteriota bacterium]